MNRSRVYVFNIEDNNDCDEGAEASLNIPKRQDVCANDFRVIIALCCTLILRCGRNLDPKVVKKVKQILLETDLTERLN